jgi:hypothetical protein
MRFLLPAALAVALMIGHSASAYDLIGAGTASCATWTAHRSPKGDFQDEAWILGFLSGVGYMGSHETVDPLHGVDAEAVVAWVDRYCRTHPLEMVVGAGSAFVFAHPR